MYIDKIYKFEVNWINKYLKRQNLNREPTTTFAKYLIIQYNYNIYMHAYNFYFKKLLKLY